MRDKYFVIADLAKIHVKLRNSQECFDEYEKRYWAYKRECEHLIDEVDRLAAELTEIVKMEEKTVGASKNA